MIMKLLNAALCCLSLTILGSGIATGEDIVVAEKTAPAKAVKTAKKSDAAAERQMRTKLKREKREAARKKTPETNAAEKRATDKKTTEKNPTEKNPTEKNPTEKIAIEKKITEKNAIAKVAAEKKAIDKKFAEKSFAEMKPAASKATVKQSGEPSSSRFQMLPVGNRIVILDTQSGETRIIESDAETMQQSVEIGKSWVTVTVLVNAPGNLRAKSLLTAPRK
jgi:hypothetical protein